nr:hypothetical protein CFP56_11025 [Quercus suber]
MAPAKKPNGDDARSDASGTRERQVAAAAHARKSKAQQHVGLTNGGGVAGSGLKELALTSTENGGVVAPEQTLGGGGGGNELDVGDTPDPQHLPCRARPFHTSELYIVLTSGALDEFDAGQTVADDGTPQREAASFERPVGVGGSEAFQRSRGQRDRRRRRIGIQSQTSRSGVSDEERGRKEGVGISTGMRSCLLGCGVVAMMCCRNGTPPLV